MATHSIFLPGEAYGQRILAGYWLAKSRTRLEKFSTNRYYLQRFIKHFRVSSKFPYPLCMLGNIIPTVELW